MILSQTLHELGMLPNRAGETAAISFARRFNFDEAGITELVQALTHPELPIVRGAARVLVTDTVLHHGSADPEGVLAGFARALQTYGGNPEYREAFMPAMWRWLGTYSSNMVSVVRDELERLKIPSDPNSVLVPT